MSEILAVFAALPAVSADILVAAAMFAGGFSIGASLAIWHSYREAAKDEPADEPTPRRENRRRNRDRRDHDA